MSLEGSIADIVKLRAKIEKVGNGYFHSTPLSTIISIFGDKIELGLYDWGLIGAMAEAPLLLTGDTDRGKTDFAKIVMAALFGSEEQGWHKTNIDLDFGSLTYSETNFGAIQSGASSDELFYAKPFIQFPGLIWDEPNRAPPKLLNKLLHILEKDFVLENGKRVFSGKAYGDGGRYQYHILAMNEGEEFHGTSLVDRAMRRRQTIEIPIDVFDTTMADKRMMGQHRTGDLMVVNGESHFDELVQIVGLLPSIPISEEAEHFRLYLQSMSHCQHSLTKTKKGIAFGEHICTSPPPKVDEDKSTGNNTASASTGFGTGAGCHHLASYPDQMCPNVYGLTDGVSIRFGTIARAHAMLRAAKTLEIIARYLGLDAAGSRDDWKKQAARIHELVPFFEQLAEYTGSQNRQAADLTKIFVERYISNLRVEPVDFYAVFPFVCYSKIELNQHWVDKNFQGSRWFAVQKIAREAYNRVTSFQQNNDAIFKAITQGKKLSSGLASQFEELCKNDLWLQQSVKAYEGNGPVPITSHDAVLKLLE